MMLKKKVKRDKKLLNELAEGLKKSKKSESQKKDGTPEDEEFLEGSSFEGPQRLTPAPSVSRTPVLEAIAGEQARPIFVNRGQSPQNDSEEKGDVGYSPKDRDSNEPKYSSSSSSEVYSAERTDTQDLGRSQNQQFQEISFKSDSRLQGESTTRRKSWNVERFDSESAGRKNPSELDEIKYQKYESKA